MTKKIFFFSDIDDTLIQTSRKTDFTKKTIVGSYNRDGEESSFFYEGTKLFIDTIIDAGINFIPTTARNLDAYKRTIFYKNEKITYVILNFGALILVNNIIDKKWSDYMLKKYKSITSINTIYDELNLKFKEQSIEITIKIIDSYYISIYNKYNLDNKNIIKKIKKQLELFLLRYSQYYLYENGNSFGILPIFLNKQFAVDYLIKKELPILTIGAGDNISDLDFMKLTSFKLLPDNKLLNEPLANSNLHKQLVFPHSDF